MRTTMHCHIPLYLSAYGSCSLDGSAHHQRYSTLTSPITHNACWCFHFAWLMEWRVRKPNLGIGWRVPDESLTVGHEQLACLSKEEVAVGGGDGERDAT